MADQPRALLAYRALIALETAENACHELMGRTAEAEPGQPHTTSAYATSDDIVNELRDLAKHIRHVERFRADAVWLPALADALHELAPQG